MNHADFLRRLAEQFPEVAFGPYGRGLLHCEMADFRGAVEAAMDAGRQWRTQEYLEFLDDCREQADAELRNAIDVSFLEDFALGHWTAARRQAVHERMPARLREAIVAANPSWR